MFVILLMKLLYPGVSACTHEGMFQFVCPSESLSVTYIEKFLFLVHAGASVLYLGISVV